MRTQAAAPLFSQGAGKVKPVKAPAPLKPKPPTPYPTKGGKK